MTGFSNQSIEWIAQNGDGWIHYPRIIPKQTQLINDYHELWEIHTPGVIKPFTQTLYIDLSENTDVLPVPIHLGFRVGSKQLLEILYQFQSISVNHLAFVLYFSKRHPEEVIQELGEFVRPFFLTHKIPV
ncbi:hypothetical protein ACQCWA_19220 [Rossellomorea aquimaris]|uniref:hypothetical protein n=1 Tax=Rossellomorea aquimaris TaxID=189382 RepID=UPI003CEB68B8